MKRFMAVSHLPIELEQKIHNRWKNYGIPVEYVVDDRGEVLTLEKSSKLLPDV